LSLIGNDGWQGVLEGGAVGWSARSVGSKRVCPFWLESDGPVPAAAGGCGSDHESRPSSQVVLPTSEFKSIHGLDWGECEVSLQSSNYRATAQRFPPLVVFLTFWEVAWAGSQCL